MFPIYDVSGATTDRPEALGTKEKFWLLPSAGMGLPISAHLFKIGRPGTGENWVEKFCFEVLSSLHVPAARYHFAVHDSVHGVISERFMAATASFYPANTLLATTHPDYDRNRRFGQVKYQLPTTLGVIRALPIQPPAGAGAAYAGLDADDFFIGYLLFDALVGNTDRHHENWGVVIVGDDQDRHQYHLAPTFDHASSLGRNESDEARLRRIGTKDTRDSVEAYARRARSAFFKPGNVQPGTMLHEEVVRELVQAYPEPTKFWAKIFTEIPLEVFRGIFARISAEFISPAAVEFAMRMLVCNQAMLRKVVLDQ